MKLNWNPTNVAFIDFETQSQCELVTVHKYATHPSTCALTCVVKPEGYAPVRLGPYLGAAEKEYLHKLAQDYVLVAHNAPFDAAIWEHTLKLPEAEWFDTLPCCRAAGLPGMLDRVGKVLTGQGKDKNGERLIDMLCIIRNGRIPAVGPAHTLLLDYNERDVLLLEEIYEHVKGFTEPDVATVDRVINDRGVPIARDYMMQLRELYKHNAEVSGNAFDEQTGGVNPTSPKQVKEWMRRMGFKVPVVLEKETIGRTALKHLHENPEEYFVGADDEFEAAFSALSEAFAHRNEVVRVGKGKAEAAYEGLEHDDRLREQFVYWKAHTGRWAGRSLQLHNMPHAVDGLDSKLLEPTYEVCVQAAKESSERLGRRIAVADVISALLRHMVRADNLLVADYNAVEARGTAWVAREQKMLALYGDPTQSVYLDMGQQLFGRPISKKGDKQEYELAKTLVLGCGYGMSGAKFEYTLKSRGVDTSTFDKLGMKISDAVSIYRKTYPRIPAVWKEYHEAVHAAVRGIPTEAGRCKFYMVGRHLHAELPSGRCIVYRNARSEPRIPGYCKLYGMPETPVPTVVFDHVYGYTGFLYGSKICENMVQGICRDCVADALVNCESEGLKPCLHVHDEICNEADDSKMERFMEIMATPPSWAPDFPLLAEGFSGPIWTKNPKGYREVNSLNGRILR